ncbi:MAG: DUF5110 domain-containing protein [Ruminococcaceae bacterium]|nr:DUF5110 domain-containing protein [Oscillospiraceae bacterium]
MKKQFLIFLAACIMAVSVLALGISAATVYVSDGGTGDGSSVQKPLGSLTDAYAAVGNEGEIVLCGTVTVPLNKGDTTRTAFVEPAHSGKITLRGNDSSSTLLFASPYEYHMSGETEFKDMIISSGAYTSGINFTARGHHLTMGENLTMYSSGTASGQVGTKLYLHGGCIPGATVDGYLEGEKHLTIKSGTYWGIIGFDRNVTATTTGKVTIEIGGNVHVHYFVAGESGSKAYAKNVTANIYIIGNLSVSKQFSLGSQHTDSDSYSANLILKDGVVDFTGTYMDYNGRTRISDLDIYVNDASASAVATYASMFAGYGDREGTLKNYCENEFGAHTYNDGVCTACGVSKAAAECTTHKFATNTEGTVVSNTCNNCGFTVKSTTKNASQSGVYTYADGNLRVQILSDSIVRVEESKDGAFVDKATLVVPDRSVFEGTNVTVDNDGETVILSTEKFTVNIPKTNATAASVKIFDKSNNCLYSYFETAKSGFYSSLPAPADTPDAYVIMDNGIIPADSGLVYAGSEDENSDWTRTENSDVYVLLPLGDSIKLRYDFVTLTGKTMMSDIKTLGSWYSKWTKYSAEEKLAMIEKYRTEKIPLDMVVIDTEWKNTSANGNDGDGTGYVTNDELYPNMPAFLEAAEKAGVLVLFNDHTHQTSLTITTPAELKWQCAGISSLMEMGLDGWWYDRNWSYSIKSPYSDVLFSTIGQVLYYDTMEKYHNDTIEGKYPERVLLLSNVDWIKHGHITGNPSIIGHRYSIQWTGDIYGHTDQLKREIENMVLGGTNGASPYMSSDLGGFWCNDAISKNHFIRWMQYGAFSPTIRVHSTLSSKNEHLPWSYGADAQRIIKNYLDMRYHLMPYYYMLARENYDTGMPLMRRLDFYYPEYEEAKDNSQYLIGKDILVAPFWSTTGDGRDVIPESWLKTPDGKPGLFAEYFNTEKGMAKSEYFTGSADYSEIVPNIGYYWYTDSPHSSINTDYFAARFTGTVTPTYDCYIGTFADDGARVYVDGKLWSDGYASSQGIPYFNNTDVLKAGKSYDVVVEYYELSGKAICYFASEPVNGYGISEREVFIPDGTWQNAFTGEKVTGPQTITVKGNTDQMPIFIREGAAIPVSEVISPMNGANWQNLSVNLYGLSDTSFTLYEDDGETEGYLDGKYRNTTVSVKSLASDTWKIDISAASGNFDTDYTKRNVTLRIHSATPISAATVGENTATVTPIFRDESALPFANSGASAISHVYEITAEVDLSKGESILVTTGILGDVDNNGYISINDVLLALRAMLNQKGAPATDFDNNGKLELIDVLKLMKEIIK